MSKAGSTQPGLKTGMPRSGGRRDRRWTVVAALVVVVAVAAVVFAFTTPFSKATRSKTGVQDNTAPTSLATVSLRDLTSQTPLNATLGYAGSYTVVNQAAGSGGSGGSGGNGSAIFTQLPTVGPVISQGQVLYRVNGQPVVLLYGTTPAYRSLSEGASASDVTGADVAELNANLVALGYATTSEIPAGSNEFSWWTNTALEKLQKALGVDQTGTLALGQAIFLPTAARVTTLSATLGGPAQTGTTVLQATSTARQVTINLDAAQQAEVKVGDKVSIVLPNGRVTPGVVSSVGTVAASNSGSGGNGGSGGSGGEGSNPTVTVLVTPTDPAGTASWDEAPVTVTVTTASVHDVLVVPVTALLAISGGGYAIEAVDPTGFHHLVDVSVGIFDDADGLVQVSGSGLAAGQKVVVPST
jgi:hypothetical protein